MPLRLYDPTEVPVQGRPRAMRAAPRLQQFEGLRIGLLANGKVKSETLLHATARLFAERHGCRIVADENKHNATRVCDPALLATIAERADFLITAVGD